MNLIKQNPHSFLPRDPRMNSKGKTRMHHDMQNKTFDVIFTKQQTGDVKTKVEVVKALQVVGRENIPQCIYGTHESWAELRTKFSHITTWGERKQAGQGASGRLSCNKSFPSLLPKFLSLGLLPASTSSTVSLT